jgi:hypothetical protein
MSRTTIAFCAVLLVLPSLLVAEDWKPAKGPLMTRWAKDVSPEKVHPEYPRPQMTRDRWSNLNGLWDYAIRPRDEARPTDFDGEILVPFAIESALSGVMKKVGDANRLWYRRAFDTPKREKNERLLLHFGAVDWDAKVWVNGKKVGEHRGGYTPFSFDITDALEKEEPQKIVVSVWDPTNKGYQPRGKQVSRPGGIWYTSVTGIWSTVWLEPVPAARIASLTIVPDIDDGVVRITVNTIGTKNREHSVVLNARIAGGEPIGVSGKCDEEIVLRIDDAKLWSPEHPHLYDLSVSLIHIAADSEPADQVASYFGMRKIAIGKGPRGFNRLFLNHRPLFQFGPLDQGWWPDGLYTAATDEALRYDVEMTRKIGFNMARKHVKVEPARWYHHCDRLGLLVWQDMPNGDGHIGPGKPDFKRSAESAANFRRELKEIIDSLRNHPSIVVWVPFNEGWGQFDTDNVLSWVKEYDPTRLVDGPSGWTDRGSGDIYDIHSYPGPAMPKTEERRVAVLGEFGGLGLPLEGHLWWNKRNWGYRTYKTREELDSNYAALMKKLHPLVGRGLAAAIYTQTSDVEGEVNGIVTYDRARVKMGVERLAELNRKLYTPPPTIETKVIVPTSETSPQKWRHVTTKPADGWNAPDFDDAAWKEAPGGFGEPTTPRTKVRTEWLSKDIWIRRSFTLANTRLRHLHLRVHHDEDAEIYINGQLVKKLTDYSTEYLNVPLGKDAVAALRKGRNVLAIHCHQTTGGQYIDAGIVEVVEHIERHD